jgi:hypothetical protein
VKHTTPGAASARLSRYNVLFGLITAGLILVHSFSLRHVAAKQVPGNDLITHEWGTFTSIAGPDGQAMDWLPLTGSTDLPSFVEHLSNVNDFKGGLRGTVRMETPVLYFYAPRETTVSVHVTFSDGLITEWYPHAVIPGLNPRKDITLGRKAAEGSITWNSVRIDPAGSSDFPSDPAENHYYAARQTSSATLTVNTPSGPQRERFLFYRGVSTLLPPLTATFSSSDRVLLQNHSQQQIPNLILFERRGSKVGYRMVGPLTDRAPSVPPALDGSLESLFSDLEGILIGQGLFPGEAHAMLETWKNSWFEEGSRILYVVPRAFVDSVLPLTITPAPAQLTRVFVGRVELVTPTTQRAVESAFASGDRATLAKYNRFVEPILSTMVQSSTDPARRRLLTEYLNSAYTGYYARPRN